MYKRLFFPLGIVLATAGSGGPGGGSHLGSTAVFLESEPPRSLTISEPLLRKLTTLAAGLNREVILCLTGFVSGDRATAEDFDMPVPVRSTLSGAAAERCPEATVAIWHNHPPISAEKTETDPGVRVARPNRSLNPRVLCTLSPQDIEAARVDRPPFMMVAVDEATWCWWSLDQIQTTHERGSRVLPSVKGQRSWD